MYATNVQQDRINCCLENSTKQFRLCRTNSSAVCESGKQGEQMSIVQADLQIHHKSMAFSMLEGRWVAILQ